MFGLIACGNASSPGESAAAGATAGGASGNGPAAGSAGAPSGGSGSGGKGAAGGGGVPTSAGAGGSAGAGARAGTPSAGAAGRAGAAGGAGAGGGSGGGAFADVQTIFNDRCVTCHDKSKVGLPSYPQLSLVAADSRAALVNKSALETCGGKYVVPGQPSQSYLVHKVSDATPCDGNRMPAPFEVLHMVPLSAEQIATISAWIGAGAQ